MLLRKDVQWHLRTRQSYLSQLRYEGHDVDHASVLKRTKADLDRGRECLCKLVAYLYDSVNDDTHLMKYIRLI